MDNLSDNVPVVFFLARTEWVDSEKSPDPDHLVKWERSLEMLGLEKVGGGAVSCSVTYPDGGPATCDDHGLVGAFEGPGGEPSIPAIIGVQPDVIQGLRSPDELVQWEKWMASIYGIRRSPNAGAGSSTDTETRPDAGPGLTDCDVKGD